jgi:hypothetical protein
MSRIRGLEGRNERMRDEGRRTVDDGSDGRGEVDARRWHAGIGVGRTGLTQQH